MSGTRDLERLLSDWMASAAPSRAPRQTVEDAIATTSQRRPRSTLLALMRTSPMSTPRPGSVGSIPVRWAYLAFTGLVAVALAVGGVAAGARLLVQASEDETSMPAPFGPARNGLIAYDSFGDIWVVHPDGTGARQLTSGPDLEFSPVWAPDGRHIAYWSIPNVTTAGMDQQDFATVGVAALEKPASLLVMTADGSSPRTLVENVRLTRREALPHWSPDSQQLVFAQDVEGGTATVSAVKLRDGSMSQFGPGEDPVWSPDGDGIVYKGGRTSEEYGLYLLDLTPDRDGNNLRLTEIDGPNGILAFWEPQWAPEAPSRRLAFYGPDFDVWRVDVSDMSGPVPGSELKIADDPANEYFPMWSPDGSRIAWVRVVDSVQNLVQAVIADPDGSAPLPLEHPPLLGVQLIWSPDGRFVLGSPPGLPGMGVTDEILLLDVDGRESPRSIAAPSQLGFSGWQRLALDPAASR